MMGLDRGGFVLIKENDSIIIKLHINKPEATPQWGLSNANHKAFRLFKVHLNKTSVVWQEDDDTVVIFV